MSGEARDAKDGTESRTPAEIRAEIAQTRAELGETVAAVAEKTDVKAQAQAKADEVKGRAQENPGPLAIAGGVVVLFVLWRLLRR